MRCRVLIATVHAAVAVMVDGAVAHIQLIHHIHYTHDDLWVMSGITVNLHIEDMTTTCHLMIRSLLSQPCDGQSIYNIQGRDWSWYSSHGL